ncbi:PREDICTED: uncharacterized protein LOC105363459 [Ceratosolen solmsi marchali]|uniref:Uncharacterized protein LOC105363459 n=1 Tax=Ceratosolen solmsi marchali TaxID=326594 RepID=A0AAJ7DWY5_9HYME|nr:PREDICTED: uncharacterized protein LOC105363459 [Ceratosolen solmsi marchali]
MDKIICNTNINKQAEVVKTSSKEYLEDSKSNNELLRVSSNSNCWWSHDIEEGKPDSRQRWSFGSDISIEAAESIQNRLCCSPVDEFDSIVNIEIEELIVNGTDERDESYKNYIQVSPDGSPTFKKVVSNDDNKKQSKNQDVDTADDELIDYSKRYTTDSSMSMVENKHINSSNIQHRQQRNIVLNNATRFVPEKKSTAVNKVDPYGDYPETDLDQPTNYSLRYAEEDSDEEEKQNPQFYCTGDQEDTIKTYYTEGTPYQTPCNFSNATSISDLLSLEDIREGDEVIYKKQFLKDGQRQEIVEKTEKAVKDCRNRIKKKHISRDSKISILNETRMVNDQKICEGNLKKLHTPPQSPAEPCDKEKENKAVTFNVEENYAQETPLMFSRSSSLDSLSEFEQHSIHDDHSSIISDHSHRTSGVVSPSELPDSPTQITSSNAVLKHINFHSQQQQSHRISLRSTLKKSHVQRNDSTKAIQMVESLSQNCEAPYEKSIQLIDCGSVFEDGLVTFKEESMPSKMHSTTASSLSSLTIDDDEDNGVTNCNNHQIMNKIAAIKVRTSAAGMHQAPVQKQYCKDRFSKADKLPCQPQPNELLKKHSGYRSNCLLTSSTKENVRYINIQEDDNEYTTFVNKDEQNNIYRDSLKYPWYENELKNNDRNHLHSSLSGPVALNGDNKVDSLQRLNAEDLTNTDTIRVYCTENTPTFVSPFGSQSNLSALSMLSVSDENLGYSANFEEDEQQRSFYDDERPDGRLDPYGTDASSDFSEDNDKCYDDEGATGNTSRRIDVSPFDSQMNLANFSLLCIQEENEEEEEEEEQVNNETEKSTKIDHYAEDDSAYKRLLPENSDYSDEESKVLEECIKSGVSKLTRRINTSDNDKRRLF